MTNNSRSLLFQLKPRTLSVAIGLVLLAHTSVYADSTYGPIAQGETLSKIVNENYPVSEYSDAIIMREIFRENPESFIANNMGLLKQGVKLVLPDSNSIRRSLVSQGLAVKPLPSSNEVAPLVSSARAVTGSNRIVTVQESLRLVRAERDGLKSSLSQANAALSSLQSRFDTAQKRLLETEEKTVVATPPIAPNAQALSFLEENLNRVRRERDAAKTQSADSQAELDRLKVKLGAALDTTSDLETKLETAQLVESELNTKLKTALSVESDLTAKLGLASNDLTESKAAMTAAAASLAKLEQGTSNQSAALIAAEITRQSLEKSNALLVEKDKRITGLETSIKDLEKQLSDTPVAELAVETNDAAQRVESDKLIADLNQQLVAYKDEVKELQSQNDELVNELMAAPAGDLDSTMEVDPLVADGLLPEDTLVSSINDVSESGSSNFLTKSVVLPTWSALLALLAVGLTGLMILLGRRNKSAQVTSGASESDVVFKSGNLDARDQDIEALRVPPRRDPSRVAILDPTMSGELVTTPSTLVTEKSSVITEQSDSNDADLKLAMAEAYLDLSDTQAANELLHEVLLEGTSQQQSSAELLMSRLAG